jgi:hypothetical protein
MKLTQQQQQDAQATMKSIIYKCWEDESFKASLVKSPAQTIEAFTGKSIDLPKGVRLVVNDQTDPSVVHINIPVKPNLDNLELTDEQLELVSGGELVFATGIGIGLAIVGLFAAGMAMK